MTVTPDPCPHRLSTIVRIAAAAAVVALLAPASGAQTGTGQPMDADFAERVREWTTRPEFLSPLVDHLPAGGAVPSPKDVLGHHVGVPRELTYYADMLDYYRALADASPRVAVSPIGRTDEGREMVVVTIADGATVAELQRYRRDLARLADPRGLGEGEAQAIVARAKPIYVLMAGLHSGETGPPEMLMELAYRLAVEEGPLYDRIRENLIVALIPAVEPDGRDRYVDWYYRHLIDITDEDDRIGGPPYWGKYIFHDNNRDINYSQLSMRNVLDWYLAWHPPIMHDLHESVPFLYTFSGQAPQNPLLDPIVYGELPWFANFEMARLTGYGMPGVWTHGFVDMWSPGYLAFMASNHNGLIRFYETFGNGGATTMKRRLKTEDNTPEQARTSREWYRPSPPYEEVEWSMRNNTNYSQTAALAALELTASNPTVILENFYRKSRNAVAEGEADPPHGFVIPAGQRDMTRVATLVELLRIQGIEVGRAGDELAFGGDGDAPHPAGSYVVKGGQPYFRLAKILLGSQTFPDDGLRTYDDTGWTMGLMLGVDVVAIDDPEVLDAPAEPVTEARLAGTVAGDREPRFGYAVAHYGSNHLTTLRYRLADTPVEAVEEGFDAGGREFPPGSFIVPAAAGSERAGRLRAAVIELGLTAVGLDERPEVAAHPVDLPRLAIYSTWGDTQEVGWVRHAFDRFEIPFDLIFKERVRTGALRADYDVILVPNQGRTAKGLVFDVEPRGAPRAYTRTGRYRFLGDYGSSDDITGGMGLEGVLELQRFAEAGGLLVTLGEASHVPPAYGLTREIGVRRPGSGFYAPGPLVEAEIADPDHPIFYGYDERRLPVRYANGPLLDVPRRLRDDWVLMTFSSRVLSGHLRGASQIEGRPAVVDVPRGEGRVVLFATNPCYRWQNHAEFGMLFNTLLHHNDLAAGAESPPAPAEDELKSRR